MLLKHNKAKSIWGMVLALVLVLSAFLAHPLSAIAAVTDPLEIDFDIPAVGDAFDPAAAPVASAQAPYHTTGVSVVNDYGRGTTNYEANLPYYFTISLEKDAQLAEMTDSEITVNTSTGTASAEIAYDDNWGATVTIIFYVGKLDFADTGITIPATETGTAIDWIDMRDAVSGGFGQKHDLTFSAEGLPEGLYISSDGIIQGVPLAETGAGTAVITVQDLLGNTDTVEVSYGEVTPGEVVPMFIDVPLPEAGDPYDETLTNGVTVHNYEVSSITPLFDYDYGSDVFEANRPYYFQIYLDAQFGLDRLTDSDIIVGYENGSARGEIAHYDAGGAVVTVIFYLGGDFTFVNNGYDIPSSTVGAPITPIDVTDGVSGGYGQPHDRVFSAEGLPEGIEISEGGIISGTPTQESSVGTATITVTDLNGDTRSIVIAVGDITEGVLTSIEVTTLPDKVDYTDGENFDPTGMVLTGYYSNGNSAVIEDYTYTPDGALTVEDTEITIIHNTGSLAREIFMTTVPVTVTAETIESLTLEAIAVTTAPDKVVYTKGETFDKTGMVVTALYSDGTRAEITDYVIAPIGALGTDDKQITVSYTQDGVTKTATFSIQVNDQKTDDPTTDDPTTDDPTTDKPTTDGGNTTGGNNAGNTTGGNASTGGTSGGTSGGTASGTSGGSAVSGMTSPKTGDTNNLLILGALMAASLAAGTTLIARKRLAAKKALKVKALEVKR